MSIYEQRRSSAASLLRPRAPMNEQSHNVQALVAKALSSLQRSRSDSNNYCPELALNISLARLAADIDLKL